MDSKQANRIRSNGIAQGCEDSRWMRERIAELERENKVLRSQVGILKEHLRNFDHYYPDGYHENSDE